MSEQAPKALSREELQARENLKKAREALRSVQASSGKPASQATTKPEVKTVDKLNTTGDPDLYRANLLADEIIKMHRARLDLYNKESKEVAKENGIFGAAFGWLGLEFRNAFRFTADSSKIVVKSTYHGILAGLHGFIKDARKSAEEKLLALGSANN